MLELPSSMSVSSFPASKDIFDDDDDSWQDMPVIREDTLASGLDERTKRNITIKLELEALLRHRHLPMLLEI